MLKTRKDVNTKNITNIFVINNQLAIFLFVIRKITKKKLLARPAGSRSNSDEGAQALTEMAKNGLNKLLRLCHCGRGRRVLWQVVGADDGVLVEVVVAVVAPA